MGVGSGSFVGAYLSALPTPLSHFVVTVARQAVVSLSTWQPR